MSLRQLRARLDRLEARFPEGDEESIARARYDHLHLRIARGELELLTDAEKDEHGELSMSLVPHLPPATTDEERAARAALERGGEGAAGRSLARARTGSGRRCTSVVNEREN